MWSISLSTDTSEIHLLLRAGRSPCSLERNIQIHAKLGRMKEGKEKRMRVSRTGTASGKWGRLKQG